MIRHCLFLVLYFFSVLCYGQSSFFVNNEKLPADYNHHYSYQNAQRVNGPLGIYLPRDLRKSESKYYYESSYYFDNFILNGKIIYNKRLTKYINQLADTLFRYNPIVRKKMKFFIVESSEINAYANNQGMIFINVGLLSRVQNEAELAFILCHEAVHFVMKHNIKDFFEGKEIDNNIGKYKDESRNKTLLKHSYERGNESVADSLGFQIGRAHV